MIPQSTEENKQDKVIPADSVSNDIFERMRRGESIPLTDPQFARVAEATVKTRTLLLQLNTSVEMNQIRATLGEVIGSEIDEHTRLFPPFYTNYGRFITLGKNVFINHNCSFLDLGGITLEDNVQIGPSVNLVTENHPLAPEDRHTLLLQPIVIKRNAWIGASAIILPGVTIGENAVVAAGALVNKDVPANTVVGGIPAKIIKSI